jgi:hypothetical protein
MRVRIQVVVESDQGDPPVVQEIAALERGPLGATGGKLRSGARELARKRPNKTDRKSAEFPFLSLALALFC